MRNSRPAGAFPAMGPRTVTGATETCPSRSSTFLGPAVRAPTEASVPLRGGSTAVTARKTGRSTPKYGIELQVSS